MINRFKHQLEQYEKFWNRETLKRPILNISAFLGEPFRAPESLEQKWFDEEYILAAALHKHQNTYYVAEAVPFLFTNLGPGCLAGCIGGSFKLNEKTIWYDRDPIIDDWDALPDIKLYPESEMYQHIERMQKHFFACGDINTTITDIGGVVDIIASLRGTENLLYDLYDYPDEVKELTDRVTDMWLEYFNMQVQKVTEAGQPFNNWFNIPSSKPWYPLQCDFAYMISPKQFEEFILPHLTRQVAAMDRSIYHLDGVGEIPHVDMLLDIEGLTGIQWVAGGGQPPLWDEKWFPLYKKIQDKKKNLVLVGGLSAKDLDATERLIKTLDPTGVSLSFQAGKKETADRLLECIDKWTS